jgi:hypothetical protein
MISMLFSCFVVSVEVKGQRQNRQGAHEHERKNQVSEIVRHLQDHREMALPASGGIEKRPLSLKGDREIYRRMRTSRVGESEVPGSWRETFR